MYTKEQANNLFRIAAKARTKEWNLLKLAEECSELSAAIIQHITKDCSEVEIQNEIGDVEIMIDILKIIYSNKVIENSKQNKYKKIENKLNEIINKKVKDSI